MAFLVNVHYCSKPIGQFISLMEIMTIYTHKKNTSLILTSRLSTCACMSVLKCVQCLTYTSMSLKENESWCLTEGKGLTNLQKDKSRIGCVVLGYNWRYWNELTVFNIYILKRLPFSDLPNGVGPNCSGIESKRKRSNNYNFL